MRVFEEAQEALGIPCKQGGFQEDNETIEEWALLDVFIHCCKCPR